jgi:hypothetical protein
MIRSEDGLSARNGRSGQNPNCGISNIKNTAPAWPMMANASWATGWDYFAAAGVMIDHNP